MEGGPIAEPAHEPVFIGGTPDQQKRVRAYMLKTWPILAGVAWYCHLSHRPHVPRDLLD